MRSALEVYRKGRGNPLIYTDFDSKGPIDRLVNFCQIGQIMDQSTTKTAILSIADLKAEDLPVLTTAIKALPGVEKIDFSIERSVAVIDFDPAQSHIDDFLRAVLKAGFQVV